MHVSDQLAYRDFVWAVELNRFSLEIVGLWPETDEEIKYTIVSDFRLTIIFILSIFFCVIPVICALIRVWGDMIFMIDNLQITLPLLIALLKLVVVRWKRPAFSCIIKMMAEDWIMVKEDTERDVMMKGARMARLITFCGYCLTMSAFIIVLVFPYFGFSFRRLTNLTDGDRILPLSSYYFYDTDKSPQYELIYVSQVILMFLIAIVYTSIDVFLGIAIFHIHGQLENFKSRLNNSISWKDFDSALSNILRIHLRLIRYVEDMFSLMMLGIMTFTVIMFCLYGFLSITVFSGDEADDATLSRKCFSIIGVAIVIGHTFLYCSVGEMLMAQCEAVYCAVCDLKWYKLKSRCGRSLVLLLMRASDPFRITAGGIIPLTMTTFCSLLKTSAGYTSFLLAKRH